jgi:hypothetical protein
MRNHHERMSKRAHLAGACIFVATVAAGPVASAKSWHQLSGNYTASSVAAGDGNYPWITAGHFNSDGNADVQYWGGSSLGWLQVYDADGLAAEAIQVTLNYTGGQNYPSITQIDGNAYVGLTSSGSDIGSAAGTTVTWSQFANVESCGWTSMDISAGLGNIAALGCTPNSQSNYNIYFGTLFGGFMKEPGAATILKLGQDSSGAVHAWSSGSQDWTYIWNAGTQSWDSEGNISSIGGGTLAAGPSGGAYVVDSSSPFSPSEIYWNGGTGGGWEADIADTPCASNTESPLSIGANGTIWCITPYDAVWYYN